MTVPEELAELHDIFQLRTQADALDLVACIVELFVLQDGEDHLPKLVYVTCSPDEEWVTGLMLVSDRTGQVPLDKPHDELTWQELVANAAEGGVTLYDWFVIADRRWAYSLPEYAPTPPQW